LKDIQKEEETKEEEMEVIEDELEQEEEGTFPYGVEEVKYRKPPGRFSFLTCRPDAITYHMI